MIFSNKRFYPQNFLIENSDFKTAIELSEKIALEAKEIAPNQFCGLCSVFDFQLRYCLPYELRNFKELKRLQYEARLRTRFQDEYYGYIIIDISEWVGHFDEHLFAEVTMSFLSYMSDSWKYIFYSKTPLKPSEYKTINKSMWFYRIHNDKKNELSGMDIIHALKNDYKLYFDGESSKRFQNMFSHHCVSSEIVTETLINDIYMFFGSFYSISTDDLISYIVDESTYLHHALNNETLDKIVKEMEELDYGI